MKTKLEKWLEALDYEIARAYDKTDNVDYWTVCCLTVPEAMEVVDMIRVALYEN